MSTRSGRLYQQPPTTIATTQSVTNTTVTMTNTDDLMLDAIIKDFPKLSGQKNENIDDWLRLLHVKFFALNFDESQQLKWSIQFLPDETLKWYLPQVDNIQTWAAFRTIISKP
ncbi:unnamed protein product [Didymodactylos carnosus]|uniref:Retrotransposon gag domain-containing protein n=1 Tax=Didymodactylos carnosus TaxID=1234261 RepID=A0A816F8L3_9BILA|nr:unnamed protein product [Didymodactylos carnosus]CAF1657940.1 unnamed protein product [Didymodactylos carnosus]CAF4197079.1 unnamed protein product [Didymodactylos carnosus]CAF4599845.1 unnamed protein product [Didymodactylos carnosus]